MEAKAVLKYTRISPRKVEIVLDLIRNKPVDLAMAILKHTPRRRAKISRSSSRRDRKRREQLQHGQKQPLCFRVLRLPGSECSRESARELREELTEF